MPLGGIATALARLPDPLDQARLHRLRSVVAGAHFEASDTPAAEADAAALAAVRRLVSQQIDIPSAPPTAAIQPDQVVWVTTPVRLDFAGGWSDTPPICTELGGDVLNAAITLNGQYPVQCMAKLSDHPAITLNSIDLGERIVLDSPDSLHAPLDPRQWHTLAVAALRLAGLVPPPGTALEDHLAGLGGGLHLTLFSALPKGSGLGTSSVLGAAVLACLARVTGETLSRDALINRTSLLEQLMGTGGGWQDQIGGLTPGVKLVRTDPGPHQAPTLHRIAFDPLAEPELAPRCLLYFTGIQRMARDILQKVVARYLARDPDTLRTVHALKALAHTMKADLERADWTRFAQGINEYWRLKRGIDPGSTNPRIETMLDPIRDDLAAHLLPGAGGGGFVFMIAQDPAAAQRIRRHLHAHPPNGRARFFDFAIDPHGLRVTTL